MSRAAAPAAGQEVNGKTFNFSLTGDDFYLYQTLRDTYDEEQNGQEKAAAARRAAILEAMDEADRALFAVGVNGGSTPTNKEISQRQVFAKALSEAMAYRELLSDAEEEAEEAAKEGDEE